jgi:hypothetical protein
MQWQSEQFGAAHEGRAVAVLADGSEPEPVYFDAGSGSTLCRTDDWWVYDGTLGAPLAGALRAACSCGWRGADSHALDWDDVDPDAPHLYDTGGPRGDWARHIADTDARSVPLPAGVTALLERVREELGDLAADDPLAALKAVAVLERTTGEAAWQAARTVEEDAEVEALSWPAVATALGLTEQDARARVDRYTLHPVGSRHL